MIKTTAIVITSIIAVLLIYLFPRQTINPGDLVKGHQQLEDDCFKCHNVFSGTPGEKCVACHKPADIGKVTAAGVLIEAMPGQQKAAFHHLLSADTCLSCHPDHKGRDIGKADRKFSHDLLQGVNMKQCTACHKGPADNLHVRNRQECSQCHTTVQWRPATLDHARYFRFDKDHLADCASCHKNNNYKEYTCYGCHEHSPAKIQQEHEKVKIYSYQNCILCHPGSGKEEAKGILKSIKDRHASANKLTGSTYVPPRGYKQASHDLLKGQSISNCISCHRSPFDNLHQTGNQNCNQCHSTDRWRPATLEHARYFRFDGNHRTGCQTCHRDNNYREYTCYGCHEHSPGKIQEEHLEEGIGSYQDCAACHPSGNEHDIRRGSRTGRPQVESGSSREGEEDTRQEVYRDSGYNYYDHDAGGHHDEDHDKHDDD